MFRRRRALALYLGIAFGVALASPPARAANITLQGTIGTDDAIQLFNFTIATAGLTPVPEPSALLFAGLGLGVLVLARRGNPRSGAQRLLGTVVLGLSAVSVQAQQSTDPDYSKVSDFLNGQRTLLQITDLQVAAFNARSGDLWITPIKTSNSQQTTQPQRQLPTYSASGQVRTFSFSVRMFKQLQATNFVTVRLANDPDDNIFILMRDDGVVWYPLARGDNPFVSCGVAADFNLDGFEDLAVAFDDGRIMVGSPNDVNNLNAGWHQTVSSIDTLLDITAGDFNGDGKPEIAGLTFAPNGGLKLVIYTVDPTSLAVTPASSLVLTTPGASNSSQIGSASIAKGRFNSPDYDQLAVAFATMSNQAGQAGGPAYVEVVDFAPNTLNPREGPQVTPSPNVTTFGFFQVKTGKFNFPSNPYDQIVYLSASPQSGGRFLQVFSVNSTNLAIVGGAPASYENSPCGYGIAVGNFDNRQPDPQNPEQTQHNLNNQIALLFGACDSGQKYIDIYSADPNSFALTLVNNNVLPQLQADTNPPQLVMLATDIQGRSLTLGEPTVITINDATQPSVVVGAPPMHVDFISPDPVNKVPPTVLNLSAVPEGFKTTYDQETSSSVKTSTANKTSWSFGAQESGTASVTIGDPDEEGLKVSDTITAAQKLKSATEHTHGTYTSKTFDLSATTGFGDEVSYVQKGLRIWSYPVIGKTVCPTTSSNCSNPVPLTIQFSAPIGDPTPQAVQGQGVAWYQPPWEPGNILSYPANLPQLQSIYPNLSQLTNGLQFLTDTSTIAQKTTWSVTTDDTTNTSFNQNYSFENDFSVSGSVGFEAVTAGGGYSINLSGSYGLSTVTNNTTTLGSSTGVQVMKPGTFPLFQNYGYFVSPYIMGTTVPGGVVDNQQLSTDVQTFGLLRAMFTADPLASGAGGWWQQAYNQAPDAALNHPSRWYISTPSLANPIPSNCLATGTGSSQMDCAELSPRSPNNPWLSPYHQMRGLFISNAASPGQGPQLETANAGDVLTLQARVYNYSLKAMPAGTEVHVRFYFTPWNETTAAGDGVLINEVALPPIPPFSNLTDAPPNWVLASTTFDTSKFDYTKTGNVSVAFWIVVWMQTPGGQTAKLVAEMPGHGLTAIPGTLKSLMDVPEECQQDGSCYSNNVGFYKQAFYICSATDQNSCGGAPSVGAVPGPHSGTAAVDISKVEISAREITPRDTVVLSATLTASGGNTSVSANFYDGDPKQGGRLIGVERIPHLRQNDPYQIQTLYRTKTCGGVHQLFVVVNKGKPSEVVRRAEPLRVTCTASR